MHSCSLIVITCLGSCQDHVTTLGMCSYTSIVPKPCADHAGDAGVVCHHPQPNDSCPGAGPHVSAACTYSHVYYCYLQIFSLDFTDISLFVCLCAILLLIFSFLGAITGSYVVGTNTIRPVHVLTQLCVVFMNRIM